jgi:hypothetical protein
MDPMAVWALIFVGGLVLLGAAMFFFGDRLRPLNRAERERSEEAARENWGKENMR